MDDFLLPAHVVVEQVFPAATAIVWDQEWYHQRPIVRRGKYWSKTSRVVAPVVPVGAAAAAAGVVAGAGGDPGLAPPMALGGGEDPGPAPPSAPPIGVWHEEEQAPSGSDHGDDAPGIPDDLAAHHFDVGIFEGEDDDKKDEDSDGSDSSQAAAPAMPKDLYLYYGSLHVDLVFQCVVCVPTDRWDTPIADSCLKLFDCNRYVDRTLRSELFVDLVTDSYYLSSTH